VPATASATDVVFAPTPGNDLVSFTSQAPGRILTTEPIDGLAAGETTVGMDMRPATSQLFALTSSGRLLIVDRSSGATLGVGAVPIPITGTTIRFDFNPTVDRIRIVTDTDLNLRVDPNTGLVSSTDTPLVYAPGDAGVGTSPTVGAAGYTNSGFGAAPATTELFGIDSGRDSLVKQDPPNNGALNTIGALDLDAVEPVHFDITGGGTRLAAFAVAGVTGSQLFSVNTVGKAKPTAFNSKIGVPAIPSLTTVGETRSDVSGPLVAVGNYTTYRGI